MFDALGSVPMAMFLRGDVTFVPMMIPDMSSWQLDWELPAGYEIVTYSEGLENEWLTIINESFNKELTVDDWQKVILDKEGYRLDRVFFVRGKLSGELCATATAVRSGGVEHGYLHFVGLDQSGPVTNSASAFPASQQNHSRQTAVLTPHFTRIRLFWLH